MPYPRGISPGRSTDAGRCCLADEARDVHSKHGRHRGRPTGRHSARCFFSARAQRNARTQDARRPGQPRKQKEKTLIFLVSSPLVGIFRLWQNPSQNASESLFSISPTPRIGLWAHGKAQTTPLATAIVDFLMLSGTFRERHAGHRKY